MTMNCVRNTKKNFLPVTGLRKRGPLKDLNDSKLIVNASQVISLIIKDQFNTIQNLQRSPIPQISNWSGTFRLFLTANGL